MRHLTASQKIAMLEHRIAQLEKQAMLEALKEKVVEEMEPFKRLFPKTKQIIKDTRKNTNQIASEYISTRKDPNFKKAMAQLRREAGPSPVKQVSYIIDVYQSGGFEPTSRTASMTRRGSFVHDIHAMMFMIELAGAILATICILDVCYEWVVSKIKGIFKISSMDKEAFPATGFLIAKVILSALALIFSIKRSRESEDKEKFLSGFLSTLFGRGVSVDWDSHSTRMVRRHYDGYLSIHSIGGKYKVSFVYEKENLTMKVEGEVVFVGKESDLIRSISSIRDEIESTPSISHLIPIR
jgi:hypothetical protein